MTSLLEHSLPMTTRKEQTNKGQSPEEARGKKGEDITGKRKREEEEKPD